MATEFPILSFTNELEDAGWLGVAASSALLLFNIPGTGPGTLTSTDQGFVWTKSLLDSTTEREINFSIGKLKMQGAALTISVGVQLKDGLPSYVDIMISFLGDGLSPSIFLEIDHDIAELADKIVKPSTENPPPPGEIIVGYENIGDPLRINFPNGALEFNFRIDKNKEVFSSLQLYGGAAGVLQLVSGIIDFDLDRVIVFHRLGGLGLYVDRLFIDLTSSGTTGFAGLFPEVYDPSWKGIGAAEITFLFPIDYEEKKFIAAGVKGFLLGFDGKFSASFLFNYTDPDEDARIKYANVEIEIRDNEFLRSEVHVGFDLKRALEQVDPNNTDTAVIDTNGNDDDKQLAEQSMAKLDEKRPNIEIGGLIDARVDIVMHTINGNDVLGFDIIMEGVSVNGTPSGIVIGGNAARMVFWIAGIGFGVSVLKKGLEADSTFKKAAGVSLILLVLADMIDATWEGKPVLPKLETLTFQKLGVRYVRVKKPDHTQDTYFEIIAGIRLDFKIESILIKALEGLAGLFGTVGLAGNLFGETLDKVHIRGEIDIEFDNIIYSKKELPAEIAVLFEQRDIFIRPKKLPELFFEEETSTASHFPKPMGSGEFVTRPMDATGTRMQYGIAVKLEGLASADFSMQTPAAGFAVFFYPEWNIEILPQVTIQPKFTFVIPRCLLAEGVFELDKPLPSFGGSQSRIKLDVGAVYTSTASGMKEYLKFDNYKYQFGGEVAWGKAISTEGGGSREYGFLFIEVHYESSTPLFVVGCVGVNGLGLIFGKNIRPGVQGSDNSAMGIANWIIGQRAIIDDDAEIFKNVRDWPDTPAADGTTWHPAIHYDVGNNSFDDIYTIGFTVKVASATDEGATFTGEGIVMVGFPEWWVAVGAIVTFKKINSELIVIVVYDRDSLAVKIVFELKIDKEGSFVKGIIPFEFGHTFSSPKRTWVYVGHYLDAKGGPVMFSFLKGLLTVKGYIDYDSDGLLQFGIIPVGEFARPDITGKAIGLGVLAQWGPKRYGPSAVNITLFGAIGGNAAKGSDPSITFGEIYLGGYVQLKVLFVKAKLELLLLLGGMTIDEGYRYVGLFMVRLNMPWPIPDWKYSTDFVIQSSDFLPLPDPIVTSKAAGLYRMQATAIDLLTETPAVLPIDAAIAFTFDKPIYGIVTGEETTGLLLNDENPEDDKISEILETDYQGLKYLVHFTHVIESISIFCRQLGSAIGVLVPEVPSTWEAPAIYEGGEPDDDAETHHTLFLNALMPPHLQFAGDQMGEFNTWVETRTHTFPCEYPGLYCVNHAPRPLLQTTPIPSLHFDTPYGPVDIRDDGISEEEAGEGEYSGQLGWTTAEPFFVTLPYKVHYDVPFPDRVHLHYSWINTKPDGGAGKLEKLISEIKIEFTVKLRGLPACHFNLSLRVDNSTSCIWAASITHLDADPTLLAVALTNNGCTGANYAFVLEFNCQNQLHTIDFIKSKGVIVVLAPGLMDGSQQSFEAISQAYSLLSPFRFMLSDLCLEDTHHPSLVWGTTTSGSSEGGDPVDTLTDHLLFQPNSEYTVTVTVRSFVATYHVGMDGTELVDEHDVSINLPQVRFRTEAEPSQNITKYVGFTYPAEGMQAPYPSSLTPMLTLKYQGLILKIFKKHYGADSLIPLLVDMNNEEIQPVLKDSIEINSGGADQALEDLLEHCLHGTEEYTHLQLSLWERSLATDMQYSLQLRDVHVSASPTVAYTVSFKTSRFNDLPAHVQYCQALFNTAASEPLLNPASFANDMSLLMQQVETLVQPGFDDLVERFYLDFMGIESGKLSPSPEQDFVSFIAGFDEDGEPLVWGVILELTEPILGKEGVTATAFTNAIPGRDLGVYQDTSGALLFRDLSGSRLLLFKRNSAGVFIPLNGMVTIPFHFDPATALRNAVAKYVLDNFGDKDPSEQATLVTDQYNDLLELPGVTEAMTVATTNLEIQIAAGL